MRWMVGVDLRDLSAGAVAFARWMSRRAPDDNFFGIHVIEHVSQGLIAEVAPPIHNFGLEQLADEALGSLRDDNTFEQLGTVTATVAEDGIMKGVTEKECGALIIGRRKPAEASSFVRLGRVARRLLRTLQVPTVVVPPDLRIDDISGGSVLIATDLGQASEGAAAFGKKLASALDLDVLVTHVSVMGADAGVLMPTEQWSTVREHVQGAGRDSLNAWVQEHGLSDARRSVVDGSVEPKILEVARVAGAAMIVVGSRGLGTFDRMFLPSVASEIAASAHVPVVIVPHDWPTPTASRA